MNVFDRMSNGWTIALNSLKVIRANKQLIIFPLLSGLSLVLVMGSFVGVLLTATGGDLDNLPADNQVARYLILFGFYLINYFIITLREKWGESLGAQFSFGLINLAGMLLIVLPLFLLGFFVHVALGVVLGLLGLFLITAVLSAARIVFISAVYHNLTGDPVEHFNQQMVDGLFQGK